MEKCLIIGYGNPLRSDDGAGQTVAKAFGGFKNIEAIAVHQLTPELAENLAQTERVYFVDAAPIAQVELQTLTTNASTIDLGHFTNPRTLLSLTRTLYNHAPKAYLVLIPAVNFELGETVSLVTQAAIPEAITLLQQQISPCMN